MLGMRLFGFALVLLGLALLGPLSTRGPAFRLRRLDAIGVESFLAFRKWFVRLIGILVVVGGVIYIVHPPAHLY
jgi:hypothetical protein